MSICRTAMLSLSFNSRLIDDFDSRTKECGPIYRASDPTPSIKPDSLHNPALVVVWRLVLFTSLIQDLQWPADQDPCFIDSVKSGYHFKLRLSWMSSQPHCKCIGQRRFQSWLINNLYHRILHFFTTKLSSSLLIFQLLTIPPSNFITFRSLLIFYESNLFYA